MKSNLSLLKRSKHILIPTTKTILYYAQIYSHLSYGILCWGSMINQSERKSIEKIQNQCVSLIDPKLPTHEIYKTYNLLKLHGLIELSNLKFGHQFEEGSLPIKIMESITYNHKNKSLIKSHHYKTRNKKLPNLPQTTHKLYRNSSNLIMTKVYRNILNYLPPSNK